jgi:hypothetical protein
MNPESRLAIYVQNERALGNLERWPAVTGPLQLERSLPFLHGSLRPEWTPECLMMGILTHRAPRQLSFPPHGFSEMASIASIFRSGSWSLSRAPL